MKKRRKVELGEAERVRDSTEPEKARLWRFIGAVVFIVAAVVPLLSKYVPALHACTVRGRIEVCEALTVVDTAPLLLLAVVLVFPTWTDVSVAGIRLRRELKDTQAEQARLREMIQLRALVEDFVRTPEEAEEAAGDEVSAGEPLPLLRDIEAEVSALLRAEAGGRMSMSHSRRLRSIERLLGLMRSYPDTVSITDMNEVLSRARSLRAAVEG